MSCKLRGKLGYRLLRALSQSPDKVPRTDESRIGTQADDKLPRFLGNDVGSLLQDRRVLDYGCGAGTEAVAAALLGARHVWGIDIQEHRLAAARARAEAAGVADRCEFINPIAQPQRLNELQGTIDCAYSIDSFEHYARPDQILEHLHDLLAPGGRLLISFGPPWKNPYGSHTRYFCRCPWIHLLFAEETIMAVRALYRDDGARRFEDVEGGLNRMTVQRFERLVRSACFELELLRTIPLSSRFVNGSRLWHPLFANPLTREYLTSIVLCRLTKPQGAAHPEACEMELAIA